MQKWYAPIIEEGRMLVNENSHPRKTPEQPPGKPEISSDFPMESRLTLWYNWPEEREGIFP